MTRAKKTASPAASEPESTAHGVLKTTVNLPADSVSALRELAAARGTSVAEIIRGAIKLEKMLHDAIKDGGKIVVEDAEENRTMLMIR